MAKHKAATQLMPDIIMCITALEDLEIPEAQRIEETLFILNHMKTYMKNFPSHLYTCRQVFHDKTDTIIQNLLGINNG